VRHLGDELSIDAIVLECLEHGLMATFSALALDILGQLGQAETSAREVKGALVVWEKLLRTRDPLLLNEQQGLWGEIQLLSRLPDLERALACWRGPEKGVVDFFGNGISLEVKTGTRPLHHTLRWHQALFGENNADVYLVSIHIQEDPTGGETLPELIGKVQSQLESNIELFRLLLKVGYREEHAESYERRFSMVVEPRFVPMVDVPSIRDLPKGVTSVHWDVDISVDSVLGSSVSEDVCRKMMGDYYE
jgi:hypothetical protein